MRAALDRVLTDYDDGRLTRRDLLAVLTTMIGGSALAAAGEGAPAVGPVRQLNHVSIFVPDVQKSRAFYQDTFGLAVLTNQAPGVNLDAGAGFLGIYPAPPGQKASINHLCFGVEHFEADTTLEALTARGTPARIRQRGETKELYLTDPDGLSVQLQDMTYIGGTGLLGNRKSAL